MSDASLDRDLYCLQCGYNLRGLSGDPVRCPECGREFLRAKWDALAEAHYQHTFRRVRRAAAACFVAVLVTMAGLLVTGVHPLGLMGIALGGSGWVVGARKFRTRCAAQPGWVFALMVHHLAVAIGFAVSAGILIAYFAMALTMVEWLEDLRLAPLAFLVFAGLCLALLLVHCLSAVLTRLAHAPITRLLKRPLKPWTHADPEH